MSGWSAWNRSVNFFWISASLVAVLGCQGQMSGGGTDSSSSLSQDSRGSSLSNQTDSLIETGLPSKILNPQLDYSSTYSNLPVYTTRVLQNRTRSGKIELEVLYDVFSNYLLNDRIITAISLQRAAQGEVLSNSLDEIVFANYVSESGRLELEFYRKADRFQRMYRRVITPLAGRYHLNKLKLFLLDNGDLMALKTKDTGSGRLEVHVLSSASNYQTFTLQTPTAMSEHEASFYRYNVRGADLVALRNDGDHVQVRMLDGKNFYRSDNFIALSQVRLDTIESLEFTMSVESVRGIRLSGRTLHLIRRDGRIRLIGMRQLGNQWTLN